MRHYKTFVCVFFLCAVLLRVLLCWANPAWNSFDDHFEPIFRMMATGTLPAKDACFQCYQPPVFHWISAMVGRFFLSLGVPVAAILKLLQYLSCLYGILTVAVIYALLRKFPLSDLSRLIAFGTVCFLPRHIYMSAMNSNDTLSYLLVAVCVYLAWSIAVERRFSAGSLIALSIALTLAVFTKYTALIVVPSVAAVFVAMVWKRLFPSRKKALVSLALAFLLPITALGLYMSSNARAYGTPLPCNDAMYDPSVHRPRDSGGISFVSFKPWEDIRTPMLVPGKLHSFWTLVYSGMWFDTEPYFQSFLDRNTPWWQRYYRWYRGQGVYPGPNPAVSPLTALTGSGLITLGLFPLGFLIWGLYRFFSGRGEVRLKETAVERATMTMFPALMGLNAAAIIALTLRIPVYCSMKASYFLNSLPAFALFLGLGLMSCEHNKAVRRFVIVVFGGLFALAAVHIVHIFWSVVSLPT